MDNRPIGVFDSGLGGLTAVREILRILPDEQIIYFGDTGRVPYGSRSRNIIIQYSRQDAAFLMSKHVKAIVSACGTASSVAGALLAKELSVPFTGVLEPTAQAAAKATRNGRIGVIATDATIRSGSFQQALQTISKKLQVFAKSCPLLYPSWNPALCWTIQILRKKLRKLILHRCGKRRWIRLFSAARIIPFLSGLSAKLSVNPCV